MKWLWALLTIVLIGCSQAMHFGEEKAAGSNPEAHAAKITNQETGDTMNVKDITWFGHASFMIKDENFGNRIYYIDPFEFKSDGKQKADIIFITHTHQDHCSQADIKKIIKNDTVIVSVNGCNVSDLSKSVLMVEPNNEYEVKGLKFRTVPAYNNNPDKLKFHPEANKWVGYIFTVNNMTVYHAGDTDFIPEMKNLGKINIAMLPIGGTYTMDVDDAIRAANAIKADVTIPMHYRRLNPQNYAELEEKFKKGVEGKVMVMEQYS